MEILRRTAKVPWDLADGRGNHRVVVFVREAGGFVKAAMKWRRRDLMPEKCGILVRRMQDDLQVRAMPILITREYGEVVFEAPAAGEYAIYFMPYRQKGPYWWNPVIDYSGNNLEICKGESGMELPEHIPDCEIIAIESRTDFDSFYPMEVPATKEETEAVKQKGKGTPFLVFPEDRKYPVRMKQELPYRWAEAGERLYFSGEARPDEHYVLQLGIYALTDLKEIKVSFGNFTGNILLGQSAVTCYNTGGIDWLGKPFSKQVSCEEGFIQPLWFGVQLPAGTHGEAEFDICLQTDAGDRTVHIRIEVRGEDLKNHGDGELWRLSRLRWLNSTIGIDEDAVAPFTPIEQEDSRIKIFGRSIRVNEAGFPAEITSCFDESIRVGEMGLPILREPLTFTVFDQNGILKFSDYNTETTVDAPGAFAWKTVGRAAGITLMNESRLEYDGHLETFVTLLPEKDMELKDASLRIAMTPACSRYMMGMGRKGGLAPESFDYRWNIDYANDFVWIGGVNGGLHLKLKHVAEVWEIYHYRKTGLNKYWYNEGKGNCNIEFTNKGADLTTHSGLLSLKAGQPAVFRYSLQITPIKQLDSDAHWRDRYDHPGDKGIDLESAKAGGATVVNLHQGQEINPYINYPFQRDDELKAEIRKAHEMGIKYKLYYTVRELTTHAQEFFALRSLNQEILSEDKYYALADHFLDQKESDEAEQKPTGGPWLCEHLTEGYNPAWHTRLPDGDYDCSVGTVGLSRWHNYYLEGLFWLVREIGADGIYLDGVGYDRQIMKRVRKVLDAGKPGCLIDFHSGNNFEPRYGLCNVLGQYMELLPSIDSLWIGEGFDYETTSPDYWLVEISGIPFGLMGDMLHRGGNKWRGMVFGMTPRCNWPEGGSPLPIWRLWEQFGMDDCIMRGWWEESCPVKLTAPDLFGTAYVQKDRMLIAIASWAAVPTETGMSVALPGEMAGRKVSYTVPFIEGFQEEQPFAEGGRLTVEPGKGKIVLVTVVK